MLVDSAAVLTSPSGTIHIPQSYRLNDSRLPSGLVVYAKERGDQLPPATVFEVGLFITSEYLAPEDWYGFMPPQAWVLDGIVYGVSGWVEEQRADHLQRYNVIYGIYFIFLLMKNTNDFRSGIFEIRYATGPACQIAIFPTGSNFGLKNEPSFANVTHLAFPPSPIAHKTNGSSYFDASALGEDGLSINVTEIQPWLPLDPLGVLISDMDILVTAAQPSKDDRMQRHIERVIPFSGVKTTISPVVDSEPPDIFTWRQLITAAGAISNAIRYELWGRKAFRAHLYLHGTYIGEIAMEQHNPWDPPVPPIEADAEMSTGMAIARRKRLVV